MKWKTLHLHTRKLVYHVTQAIAWISMKYLGKNELLENNGNVPHSPSECAHHLVATCNEHRFKHASKSFDPFTTENVSVKQ